MTFARRCFQASGLSAFLSIYGAASAAEIDYGSYRVLDTKILEMSVAYGDDAALLSPDGSRLLHIGHREMCLFAPSQIGPWAELACVEATSENRPRGGEEMLWSPDNIRLLMPTTKTAFQGFRDTDIEVFDAATLTSAPLTDDGVEGSLLEGTGSASLDVLARWMDADTIAFLRYAIPAEGPGKAGPPTLMAIDADGSNLRELLEISSSQRLFVYVLAVSPDGKQIAYSLDNRTDPDVAGIWLLDINKGEPVRVAAMTDVGAQPQGTAFSADGTKLLMLGFGSADTGMDARVLDLETGEIAPAAPGQKVKGAAWSPTGSALAYLTFDSQKPDAPGGLFLSAEAGKPGRLLIGGAFMPPSCCSELPFTWAANDTMVVGQINETGTVLFVTLGERR